MRGASRTRLGTIMRGASRTRRGTKHTVFERTW